MANGLHSMPGSNGVYSVPKSLFHSMAGCPVQSVVWRKSEGEHKVKLDDGAEDPERNARVAQLVLD